jgi:microcystin-dependent protein
MTIKHLSSLDVTGTLKALGGLITITTDGVPTAALEDGAIAVDTTNDKIYFRSGGEWQEVIGGGGGGLVVQPEEPEETDVLWLDTDEPGVSGPTGPQGETGPPGVFTSSTEPVDTSVIWADTSTTGTAVVPVGGTTGQVLAKTSGTDYETEWATPVTSSDLDLKADLASPDLTGTPTAPTATAGTNTTQIATTEFVRAEVSALVGGATTTLDTLGEIATALGNDANLSTTLVDSIALKAPLIQASPIGMITPYAGATAPTNWQLCYGQAISRTTYASLFAIIGTAYGVGDGTTTFNLPDLRGRTVAGLDNMGGADAGRIDIANSSGTVVGSQYVTLTAAQSGVPAHGHTAGSGEAGSHSHGYVQPYNTSGQTSPGGGYYMFYDRGAQTDAGGVHSHTITVNNNTAANAASAHSVMQPTMVVNYIILVGA